MRGGLGQMCPAVNLTPGFCAWDASTVIEAMANGNTSTLAAYVAYEISQWASEYCASWQLQQLACLNALVGGISTDGNGNITVQGTVVPNGPVGQFPGADLVSAAALNAANTAELFPTGLNQTNTTQPVSATNLESTTPAGSTISTSTAGASVNPTGASAPSTPATSCWNPLSAYVSDSCVGPVGMWELGIGLGLLALLFFAGGRK